LAATSAVDMYFFQEYFSPTILLASTMLFVLLHSIPPPERHGQEVHSASNKLIKIIGENTLAIFFIHVIILEAIQNGYFGLALNRVTLTPVLEVPLITVIVLFASLGIVLLLKQVPYLKKIIG